MCYSLRMELPGHRLFVLNIFIKTTNLFFHLSKTEYCHSLKFLMSDEQIYLPAVFIMSLMISSEVTGHLRFFYCLPIHILYLFLLSCWIFEL